MHRSKAARSFTMPATRIAITLSLVFANACAEHQVSVRAHYESPADQVTTAPPCGTTSVKPGDGCRGTGLSSAPTTLRGDWNGTTEYQYGWINSASGMGYAANVETFRGSVAGCGTGSFMYFMTATEDPQGKIEAEWSIIEGAGTGELAHVRGGGTLSGVFREDYTSSGEFTGKLSCRR